MLTRTSVFYRNKAAHALQTWELSDSIRVGELHELRDRLPQEDRPTLRKENFKLIPTELRLHECLHEKMPAPVETEEVTEAIDAIDAIFPQGYPQGVQVCTPLQEAIDPSAVSVS
ncbi:hypothetical protein C2845_PM11G07350 [Panicum miliaceum]|uniref:Uncharacterized protein n=1 Tax=Panicum miliaceum TaxID=4540 RepID=A0A3L6RSW4_PANMI|nr:hypothetical protein C2845_PM11G07350 [Panicum miliaceum]